MKKPDFDRLLGALRTHPIPDCPGNMEGNVLRRIRLAQPDRENSWDAIFRWLPQPIFALGALAAVVALSLVTSTVTLNAQQTEHASSARVALGFDAFSAHVHLPTDHP